jgi:hypothetical protein
MRTMASHVKNLTERYDIRPAEVRDCEELKADEIEVLIAELDRSGVLTGETATLLYAKYLEEQQL